MRLGKYIRLSRLLDIYAPLLTDRQRTVLSQYVNEDLSLYEIGELTGVSRQGVRDALIKAEANLESYDEKLMLMYRTDAIDSALDEMSQLIEKLPEEHQDDFERIMLRISDCIKFDTEA